MTGKITPDIFLSMEFEKPKSYKFFSDYLDYMFDEAKTQTKTYESYHNYMFDEAKTDSIFTKNKDFLDEMEILKQKELFRTAQENNSFMWKPIIAFNNEFLVKNNILKNGVVNDKKLKECARESIEKMLKLENISSYTYSGAIHYNTDNIHIHLSIVELGEPTRKYIFDEKLTEEERCKNALFQKSTFEKGKSVVSSVLSNDVENLKELSFLSRKKIIQNIDFKNKNFSKEEIELLKEIKEKLPLNQNLWQYNNKKIAYVKPLLNKFTTQFFYNHFKEEMKEYKDELLKTQELYTRRYGKGKYEHNFYMKNCLDDLYTRGANKILKNLKDFNLDFKDIDINSLKNPLDKLSNGNNGNESLLTEDKKLEIYFSLFKEKLKEKKYKDPKIYIAKDYIKNRIYKTEINYSSFKTDEEKEMIKCFCKKGFNPKNEKENILLNKLTNMRLENRYGNYIKTIFENNEFSKKEQKEIYKEIFKFQKNILDESIEKVKEQYEELEKRYLENKKNLDTAKYQVSLFTCFKNIFSNFEQTLQEESYHNLMRYREIEKETRQEKKKSLEK